MSAPNPQPPTPAKLEHWKLERLRPYDRNARQHSARQVEQIATSISEHGFNDPIEVMPDGTILSGHGRLEAARLLGLAKVPVLVLHHLTDAQRRAYTLAANRIAENATWDQALLARELADLEELGSIDVEHLGFSEHELRALEMSLDAAAPDGARGDARGPASTPVVSYQLILDDETQQATLHAFLRALKQAMPEVPTIAGRLVAWMVRNPPSPA